MTLLPLTDHCKLVLSEFLPQQPGCEIWLLKHTPPYLQQQQGLSDALLTRLPFSFLIKGPWNRPLIFTSAYYLSVEANNSCVCSPPLLLFSEKSNEKTCPEKGSLQGSVLVSVNAFSLLLSKPATCRLSAGLTQQGHNSMIGNLSRTIQSWSIWYY